MTAVIIKSTNARVDIQWITLPTQLIVRLGSANIREYKGHFFAVSYIDRVGVVMYLVHDVKPINGHSVLKLCHNLSDAGKTAVCISQLIRCAKVCSTVDDFKNRNLFWTAKSLKQGYRHNKIRKTFSKFYNRHSELTV